MPPFSSPEVAAVKPTSPSNRVVKLAELRRALDEKFPTAPARKNTHFLTGLEAIDRRQGLPRAAVTEICGSAAAGSLLMVALLQAAHRARSYVGLIDAGRSFDPADIHPQILKRLLWVRCNGTDQAVKSADLLLRDGNLPLLLLDLQPLPLAQLRRIPVNTWHRFHRVAEQGNAALVVLTPRPMVEGVKVRIAAENRWHLEVMPTRRKQLIESLDLKVFDKGAVFTALDQTLGRAPSPEKEKLEEGLPWPAHKFA